MNGAIYVYLVMQAVVYYAAVYYKHHLLYTDTTQIYRPVIHNITFLITLFSLRQ